ncbi:hypothetical protein BJV74DRAFT_394071 [Russula compacta]|nr:hypothetical protein BJV74DRAFT_394071 [Russula compacta]
MKNIERDALSLRGDIHPTYRGSAPHRVVSRESKGITEHFRRRMRRASTVLPSFPDAISSGRSSGLTLPAIVSTGSPRPRSAELVGQALQPSLLNLQPPPPDEDAVMQSSALHYLKRYFRTFDRDRRALAEMYASDATFSCSSRNLRAQGRDSIIDTLQALGRGVLCSGNSVEYDVTYLGPRIGVLLVVLGTMRYAQDSSEEVGYAMSFVLRHAREDPERPAGGLRSLVAAVHQMVVREDSPRLSGKLIPSAACET